MRFLRTDDSYLELELEDEEELLRENKNKSFSLVSNCHIKPT